MAFTSAGNMVSIFFYQASRLTKGVNVEGKGKRVYNITLLPDEDHSINISIYTPFADFPSRSHNNCDNREIGVCLKGFVVLYDE